MSNVQSNPGTPTSAKLDDGCPDWADVMMRQILDLEVRLGNLRPTADAWAKSQMEDVWKRVYAEGDEVRADEERVDGIFRQVSIRLTEAGFTPTAIATFANARVKDAGGLPYCNAQEVAETLPATLS